MSVAVVTGASRGIGREVARQLLELGHTVVAGARDPADVDLEGAHALRLDVTSDESVVAAAVTVEQEFGGAAILINNAGITLGGRGPALEADLDDARATAEVNVYGPWRMTAAFAPQLRAAASARVVNVSTGMAQLSDAHAGSGPYRTSKVALNMLTVIFADELRADGVLVNATCPGWVQTDMGGPMASRTVEDGAASVLWGATLPDDGPTGGFFRDGERLDW